MYGFLDCVWLHPPTKTHPPNPYIRQRKNGTPSPSQFLCQGDGLATRGLWIARHTVRTSIYFSVNFGLFKWLYLVQYTRLEDFLNLGFLLPASQML